MQLDGYNGSSNGIGIFIHHRKNICNLASYLHLFRPWAGTLCSKYVRHSNCHNDPCAHLHFRLVALESNSSNHRKYCWRIFIYRSIALFNPLQKSNTCTKSSTWSKSASKVVLRNKNYKPINLTLWHQQQKQDMQKMSQTLKTWVTSETLEGFSFSRSGTLETQTGK